MLFNLKEISLFSVVVDSVSTAASQFSMHFCSFEVYAKWNLVSEDVQPILLLFHLSLSFSLCLSFYICHLLLSSFTPLCLSVSMPASENESVNTDNAPGGDVEGETCCTRLA